jgi:hypothetical protein
MGGGRFLSASSAAQSDAGNSQLRNKGRSISYRVFLAACSTSPAVPLGGLGNGGGFGGYQ